MLSDASDRLFLGVLFPRNVEEDNTEVWECVVFAVNNGTWLPIDNFCGDMVINLSCLSVAVFGNVRRVAAGALKKKRLQLQQQSRLDVQTSEERG